MKNLGDYAKSAMRILEGRGDFLKTRSLITDTFGATVKKKDKEEIRLLLIASLLAPEFAKRVSGVIDLAADIRSISVSDGEISKEALDFIDHGRDGKIRGLLSSRYGYKNNGKPCGPAPAVVSAYLTYVTGFRFPSYDPTAKKRVDELLEIGGLPSPAKKADFWEKAKILKTAPRVDSYDSVNALIKVFAAVAEADLVDVMNPERYFALLKTVGLYDSQAEEGVKFETALKNRLFASLEKKSLTDFLGPDLTGFVALCAGRR